MRTTPLALLFTSIALAFSLALGCSDGQVSDLEGGKKGPLGGGAGQGCPDDLAYFEANLWEPLLSKKCAVCHSEGGLARGTRMVLARAGEDGYLETNFETVRDLASIELDGTSVLLLRPTGRHPDGHTGGKLVDLGSPTYEALDTFVKRVTLGTNCDAPAATCTEPLPGGRVLRRLSRSEYDATVTDLFGFPSAWGQSFTNDVVVNGFDNNAGALQVSPLLAHQIAQAAEEIATLATANLGALLPCDPAATGEEACAAELVGTLGARAFRRPLTADDSARYIALYAGVAADSGFATGIEAVIEAMLQSPHFLYRTELGAPAAGGLYALSPHEIASELSYFIWGSMPDEALFAAAESGALGTQAGIESEARRLLASPRSSAVLGRFVEQWLEVDRLPTIPKDAAAYPELSPTIRSAMREETRRFVEHVIGDGTGTLPELFTSQVSFLNDDLAAFYGLPAPPGEKDSAGFGEVSLSGSGRVGLLSQGSVITTHSLPASSSPIHRGKLVRERLLCQDLPPPPPSLNVQPPAVDPSLTTRERYAAHATVEPCMSCHRLMDPIGFGFEHFDGVGRTRETEGGKPIDATGTIVATEATDGDFDGVLDLAQKLGESPDVRACFALQWVRFAYGIEESAGTSCLVAKVQGDFTAGSLNIEDLVVALTQTSHFQERVGDDSQEPGNPDPGQGSGGVGGSSGGGQGGAGGSSPADPPPDAVDTLVKVDSQWPGGHCSTVSVTNTGSAPVTWTVKVDPDGTITDVWSATAVGSGSETTFSGVAWNATLDAQEMTSFGFCASEP